MKLTVLERFALGNMIPSQIGKFETLRLVREGRESLSFSNEELLQLNPVAEGQSVKWDPNAAVKIGEVDIPLSPFFIKLIKDELIKLSDADQLPESFFSIYEKFVLTNTFGG
jgi:hypothetical protein